MEVLTYDLFHLGAIFDVELIDCLTGNNYDGSRIVEQSIVIYKPNNVIITKPATIQTISGLTTLKYINGPDNPIEAETESILDLIGPWEYAGKVKLINDDEIQTSERFHFIVS